MRFVRLLTIIMAGGCAILHGRAAAAGAISGVVRDSRGGTLAGVWVDAYDTDGEWINSDFSSSNGTYVITNLAAGTYRARTYAAFDNVVDEWYDDIVAQEGVIPASASGIVVSAGTTSNINFTLGDGATITGLITRTGGAAISDVWVDAYDADDNIQSSAISDTNGSYAVTKLPAGYYRLRTQSYSLPWADLWYSNVQAVGWSPPGAAQSIYVATGGLEGPIDFALSTGAVIRGRVTDATLHPLTNVWVDVYTPDGDWVESAASGATGGYELVGLPAGNFHLRSYAGAANYADLWYSNAPVLGFTIPTNASTFHLLLGSVVTNINFALPGGAGISGVVSNTTGGAVRNARIDLYATDGSWAKSSTTGSNGGYSVSGLPAGLFYVQTYAGDTNLVDEWFDNEPAVGNVIPDSASGITVSAGSTVSNVNFGLAAGGVVTGRVTQAAGGAGIDNVSVYLYDDNAAWIKGGTTEAGGGYRVAGLPGGVFYVRTEAASLDYADEWYDDVPALGSGVPSEAKPVTVVQGSTTGGVNFALARGGGIQGRVTAGTNGPQAGVRVDLYSATAGFADEQWTGHDGRYAFGGLPAGNFHLRTLAGMSNYVDEWFDGVPAAGVGIPAAADDVWVTAGIIVSNVDFSLAVGGAIAGTVTGTDGVPVQAVWVDVYDAQANWIKGGITGTGGAYRVQGLSTQDLYYARTSDGIHNYVNEWFDNVPVAGDGITPGAQALAVPCGGDRTGVDFALEVGGWIHGLVSDAVGSPLVGIAVELYGTNGTWLARATTDVVGWYEFAQIAAASYILRTDSGAQGFADEWYDNVPVDDGPMPDGVVAVPVQGGAATNVGFTLGYRMTDVCLSNGQACVAWQAAQGTTYRVRLSTNLVAGAWANAPDGTNAIEQSRQTAAAQAVLLYRDSDPGQTGRFYRVEIEF